MIIKKKILFITNPFSGAKRGKVLADLLEEHLNTALYDFSIAYTEYSGHAINLAKQAVEDNFFAVVAAGGDGTINEVANALQGTDTALGVIPLGSGNGFAYHLDIKRDVIKAIEIINEGHISRIDTGSANQRFFVNVAGMGLDAAVAFKTKNNKRRGFMPYLKQSIIEGFRFNHLQLNIETPQRSWSGKYAMAVIANGSIYGYDFVIAPGAILDDALFDVLLLKEVSVWKCIALLPRFFKKTLHESPLVEYFKTDEIILSIDHDDYYHVDGEGFEVSGAVHFKIQPHNLSIITQQASNL